MTSQIRLFNVKNYDTIEITKQRQRNRHNKTKSYYKYKIQSFDVDYKLYSEQVANDVTDFISYNIRNCDYIMSEIN